VTLALTTNRQVDQPCKARIRPTNKVRVALVVPTHWAFKMGGSQYQAQLLEEVLAARGDAEIAYFAARVPPAELMPDRQIISSGRARSLRRYGHFWDYFSLQRRLEEFRPDVIYQRVRCAHTGIAARFAKRRRIPLIWHVSSDRDCQEKSSLGQLLQYPFRFIETSISKYGINSADFVIAQTSIQAEMLSTNFSIKVHKVIPNFHPLPQRTEKKGDTFTVLWIANLKAVKRPESFIEVVRLLQDLPGLRFRMIGTTYGNAKIQKAYVNTVRILSNVEYLGGLEQQEVNAHLSKSHLLVNTSVTEGFSNTFIQAWMRKVPVLTIGINPDNLFEDGIFGRCCSNVQELADTIRYFSVNPRELEKIAFRSYKASVEMFSMSNAEKLSDLIISLALGGATRS